MSWGYIGAAAVTAVAGAVSADKQAKASRQAADVQAEEAAKAAQEQQRQLDITQAQVDPFRQAGLSALEQQQALLGLSGPEAQQAAMQTFQESPGQAFLRERGEQALLRNQAAIGGLGGGEVRSALQQQGIGFAQQDLQNQLAQLSAISGRGLTATTNLGSLRAGTASNVGNLLTYGGEAQAGGILGAGAAQARGTQQVGGALAGLLASRQPQQQPQQQQAPVAGQVTSQPSVFNQQQQPSLLGKF